MKKTDLVQFLLDHNKEQSKIFSCPDSVLWRRQYRAKHPTEIATLKCMDGRLHLPVMTNTPLGIIQPFRNIGGKFDLGWPFFGVVLKDWVDYAVSKGRDALILVSYHYSKGDIHRGCKGFGYDTEAAKSAAAQLRLQIESVFGKDHSVVYPVLIGIETDEDALILHGQKDRILDLSTINEANEDLLLNDLHSLFPDMKPQIIQDLLPLVIGNIKHIQEIRASGRKPVDLDHQEQILGIGRGFDWLHLHNKALLVGPFSYDLGDPISKAAGILLDNLQKGRIPESEGVVLLSSAVYRDEAGVEPALSREKAISLARFSFETIKTHVPDLLPHLSILMGTVDMNTREFHEIENDVLNLPLL